MRQRLARERERAGPITSRHAFAGLVVAALLLTAGNALDITRAVPFPGLGLRVLHYGTDLVENLALGILAGGLVAALLTYARRLAVPAIVAASLPLVIAASGHTIWRKIMIWFDGAVEWSLYVPAVVIEASLGPALFVLGHWLGSFNRAWAIAPVACMVTLIVNDAFQVDQYFGDHCMIACGVSLLGGAAFARRFQATLRWNARRLATAAAVIVVLAVLPPANAVRVELFKVPSSVGAWAFAWTLWRDAPSTVDVAPTPWLAGSSGDRPIAPTSPPLVAGSPVVVLITVDATRADVVGHPPPSAPMPELAAMKAQGAQFTNVVSPGSQTAVSLSTMFSGRYFSQLKWDWVGHGSRRFIYPAVDPAPRFSEVLTAAGIPTTLVGPIVFLNAEYGIARGFSDHRVVVQDASHAHGGDVVNVLVDRIGAADPAKPAFFYAHLIEPHHPYDRGEKKEGSNFERYASEVALASQLIARVARAAEARFGARAILIVASDHGEAFGEHRSIQHSKTVYQEVLRVPLLVRGAGVAPRSIDEPVGIVDLGPTILDIFGQPTPPSFMGQSLVPLLAGRPMHFSRPLFAEARLHRAYFGELKVIEDVRRHTVEAYDLASDPNELHNLYGRDPRAELGLATLHTFFKDAPLLYRQ